MSCESHSCHLLITLRVSWMVVTFFFSMFLHLFYTVFLTSNFSIKVNIIDLGGLKLILRMKIFNNIKVGYPR